MSCFSDFSEGYVKSASFSLHSFRKRAGFVLVISSQKRERKLGRLVWRVVSRYWRKPEKFRIQFKNSNFMYILKYGILDKVPGVDG